ncbi:MAG: crotonase/enoyl-CoA hydratase family protein [Gammaproteobacteria bacterium]|uniref:crotonase/enoyl-CoA hydratase family protein n=1 Tax=Azohydromonas sp. TaxID=1872666 RepID=UPI002BCD2030|nr:crotonase/enoyl-CoA hydratase family protein [Azohydromonas sp.]HMM84084.1 crotonase/enoyl-CoA hydratase family protein [Azohydromonas sp.]
METVQAGVGVERDGAVWIVRLHRPAVRNAVDGPAARALADAFRRFDADPAASVAVLTGGDAVFCAGADLKAIAEGGERTNPLHDDLDADAPMGPTRLRLSKPVIAAVSGHAVAGGLELALWCDLRVVDGTAVFGVYCRRWGVPLIDGGTVRLPRLIGESRALDLILTGRAVGADEALAIGLAQRRAGPGQTALDAALALARQIAALPQVCLRGDLASVKAQAGLPLRDALAHEFALGRATLSSGESRAGAGRFAAGAGRGGQPA